MVSGRSSASDLTVESDGAAAALDAVLLFAWNAVFCRGIEAVLNRGIAVLNPTAALDALEAVYDRPKTVFDLSSDPSIGCCDAAQLRSNHLLRRQNRDKFPGMGCVLMQRRGCREPEQQETGEEEHDAAMRSPCRRSIDRSSAKTLTPSFFPFEGFRLLAENKNRKEHQEEEEEEEGRKEPYL
jgi:hypothetical protein